MTLWSLSSHIIKSFQIKSLGSVILFFLKNKKQIILIFIALNWSKVTVNTFIMLQKIYIWKENAVLFNLFKFFN